MLFNLWTWTESMSTCSWCFLYWMENVLYLYISRVFAICPFTDIHTGQHLFTHTRNGETGIELPTSWLEDDPLYPMNRSHRSSIQVTNPPLNTQFLFFLSLNVFGLLPGGKCNISQPHISEFYNLTSCLLVLRDFYNILFQSCVLWLCVH